MIQKIKKFIVVGIAGLSLMVPAVAAPALTGVASATLRSNLCTGVDAAADQAGCNNNTSGDASSGLTNLARTITKYFSIVVGAAAIIMIIYGGFRYITSGGDSGKVGNAKNTLIYAIVGLIIVALAQIIVRFVITQADTTANNFN